MGKDRDNRQAWEPFTLGGVARYAGAPLVRLLLSQLVFAGIVAASVIWFLNHSWVPVIDRVIASMPETGEISGGGLQHWPEVAVVEEKEGPFLWIEIMRAKSSHLAETADLVLSFDRERVRAGSTLGLGVLEIAYPSWSAVYFNRPKLEPWWGAKKPMVFGALGALVVTGLFGAWALLALFYMVPVKIISLNRLNWGDAWQLAAASMLPGALLMSVVVVLYGLRQLELIELIFAWAIHLVMPWLYLFFSPMLAPRSEVRAKKGGANPFQKKEGKGGKGRNGNPFKN